MKRKTLRISMLAIFIALAAVGANLKIEGSIAFDSLPAFLAAMLMGGPEGAVAGAAGHLFSALLAGFPLTLPLHLVIAAEMGLICFAVGELVNKRGLPVWLGTVIAFVLNSFISPAVLIVWPGFGWSACLALLLPLTIGSAANTVGAALLYFALKKPFAAVWRVRA